MNFNKIIIGGRITADIEKKQTNTGKIFVQFSVAVNKVGDDTADFFNCIAWDKTAENIQKYFRKGSNILIEGEMHKREWTQTNGEKRFSWDVTVRNFDFVDSIQSQNKPNENTPQTVVEPNFKELAKDEELPF